MLYRAFSLMETAIGYWTPGLYYYTHFPIAFASHPTADCAMGRPYMASDVTRS